MDSVSYAQGIYSSSDTNSDSIFCGKRIYSFGGDGSSNPSWLSIDQSNGIVSVQTDEDSDVNYNPGYSVTLKACLSYYPTTCSAPVLFKVFISECQIVSFQN